MTQHSVADDVLGKIARQQNDLFRRVREGSLDADVVSAHLQSTIEGIAMMPIRPWIVVEWRYSAGSTGSGAITLENRVRTETDYCFPGTGDIRLSIGVGTEYWDVTLARLSSRDLGVEGKDACEVSRKAQSLGLKLCDPQMVDYFCLSYNLRRGEHLVMPLYGFGKDGINPTQCADYQYRPEGCDGKHRVIGADPRKCGVGVNQTWIFELSKKWAQPGNCNS